MNARFILLVAWFVSVAATALYAGSAQWDLNPGSGDWNTTTNWTPVTVPNSATDTATFDVSNTTGVSLSANTEVNGIVFNAGASAYTITASPAVTLTISGAGITNNSGTTQNFGTDASNEPIIVTSIGGTITFTNSATAGSMTAFTNSDNSGIGGRGITQFHDTSSAGGGTFANLGGVVSAGGETLFFDNSTAGNGTFTNFTAGNDSFSAGGGSTHFFGASTAGIGTFTNSSGGYSTLSGFPFASGFMDFNDNSTAGNATLIANANLFGELPPPDGGASITFEGNSTGGTARVELFGIGHLNFGSSLTVGSIEGNGSVNGGDLTVGSNNLSTAFSGALNVGSLTKIGAGTFTLSAVNTYTGGTAVNAGTLLINNTSGSGTGSGAVQVNAGTLGGIGTIAGAVTIGTGSGPGAFLSPGQSPGTLTIQSALTLNSDATYKFELNSSTAAADKVIANGVTIGMGAQFSFTDLGNGALALGTAFTVIDDAAVSPISGTFSNLRDGSMFTANGNTFLVSYEGGDGNDLTLTVEGVPEPATWALLTAGALLCSIWRRRIKSC